MLEVQTWASLAAFFVSSLLLLYMVARSPRTAFTRLLGAMIGCIAWWTLNEWLHAQKDEPVFRILKAVGYTPLAPLFFHCALHLNPSVQRIRLWLTLAYGSVAMLLLVPLGALVDSASYKAADSGTWSGFYVAFDSGYWDAVFLLLYVPLMCAAIFLLWARVRGTAHGSRGVFGFPLAGALALAPLGFLDMIAEDIPLAPLGGALASILLAIGVYRYREVFDAIARLRESTANLFAAIRVGVVTFDANGSVIFVNPSAEELLGSRPRRLPDIGDELADLVANGGQRLVRRRKLILKAAASSVTSPLGDAAGAHLLLEDGTREYDLMREFSQRAGLASLGEAAATLSHEIRNPLTAIQSTLDTLTPEELPTPRQLDRMRSEIGRLKRILDRSLDLARPVQPDLVPCNLNRLAERVGRREPSTPPIRFALCADLPSVPADPDLIGQVLSNLLRNAREADAGDIEIATGRRPGEVWLCVRNSGTPIPEEVLGRIFQPFVTTKSSGAGVGLALCKKIVTAHGGTIDARNGANGTEFEVTLPWTY